MNILVIPTTDWLRHPTPHRHHYLAEQMAKRHNVYVLYFDIFNGKTTWDTKVQLVPAGGVKTDKLLFYYAMNAPFHWNALRKFIRKNKIDVIYAAHPTCSYLGFHIAQSIKGTNILCTFDFNDYSPEGASLYYKSPVVQKFIKGTGKFLLDSNIETADNVITVSNPMMEYVKKIRLDNVDIVTNGVDTDLFKPGLDTAELKRKYNINGPVVGFVGTVEKWFDFESVFIAFKKLVQKIPDVTFLLVGDSIKTNYVEELKLLCKDMSIENNLIVTGLVPYKGVPYYINMMDIAIMPPLKKQLLMGKFALPNKIFQYMACGTPVISAPFSEIERIAGDAVIIYHQKDDIVPIYRKLLEIEKRKGLIEKGFEIARMNSWDSKARQIETILESKSKEKKACLTHGGSGR